jgi:catechol 2,3-dioxygenase-like lactoylglutathione lyase family enzyme
MLRFDHVGTVVDDLDAAQEFFLALGFVLEGRGMMDDRVVDRIVGLDGVRSEVAMVRTPDGTGRLELIKYHAPADTDGPHPLAANRFGFRHICLEVTDLNATVDGLRDKGFDLVGEVEDFGGAYRLCYLRGPEGLIVEFSQNISAAKAG